jgi:hypothetical protein
VAKATTPQQLAETDDKPPAEAQQKKEQVTEKPSTAMVKKMFGAEVDILIDRSPTIEHPSKVFMSSLVGTIEPVSGSKLKTDNDQVLKEGQKWHSSKRSLHEYSVLKASQSRIAVSELSAPGSKLLKPDYSSM